MNECDRSSAPNRLAANPIRQDAKTQVDAAQVTASTDASRVYWFMAEMKILARNWAPDQPRHPADEDRAPGQEQNRDQAILMAAGMAHAAAS